MSSPKEGQEKGQANMVEMNEDLDNSSVMLLEYNLIGNFKEWWIDTGDTCHACSVKKIFVLYAPAGPEKTLSMGNSTVVKIEGYRMIFLKMTYGKVENLNNIFMFLNMDVPSFY